jgi:hypothetical protein
MPQLTRFHPDRSSASTRTADHGPRTATWLEMGIVFALLLIAGTLVWNTAARFDSRFFQDPAGNDVWFEADLPTVSDRILHRWSDQSRNARHPLFPLMATLPVNAAKAVLGEQPASRLFIVLVAAVWVAALYVLLRAVTPGRIDALVFTTLGCVSAAAMFWLPVPETYALGSVSVIAALALCAWDPPGRAGATAYVIAAAFSLSVTTTNWVSGLAAIFSRKPPRTALQLAANSLTLVVLLWGLQHMLFSSAAFFIGEGAQTRFVLPHGLAGIAQSLRAVLFHSMVMPAIAIVPEQKWGTIMSVQDSAVGSGGAMAIAATVLWAMLLGLGAWTLATRASSIRLPLLLALGGHLLVYAIYGEETFLYTLHIAPLLVCVAALATNTRLRMVALGSAAFVAVLLAFHNSSQLAQALGFFARGIGG